MDSVQHRHPDNLFASHLPLHAVRDLSSVSFAPPTRSMHNPTGAESRQVAPARATSQGRSRLRTLCIIFTDVPTRFSCARGQLGGWSVGLEHGRQRGL